MLDIERFHSTNIQSVYSGSLDMSHTPELNDRRSVEIVSTLCLKSIEL